MTAIISPATRIRDGRVRDDLGKEVKDVREINPEAMTLTRYARDANGRIVFDGPCVVETFLAEDVRAEAEKDGIPPPPTKKAWGRSCSAQLARASIKRVGYAPAKSSNLSPKVLWSRT